MNVTTNSADKPIGMRPLDAVRHNDTSQESIGVAARHKTVIGIALAATGMLVAAVAFVLSEPNHRVHNVILAGTSVAVGGLVVIWLLARYALPAIEGVLAQQKRRTLDAEQQYRSIFENAVEGIFQTTPDGRYLKANPMLASIYGYPSASAMMESLTDIGNQLYVDSSRRTEFGRLLQEHDKVLRFDSEVRRLDGTVIWIRENARAIRGIDGALVGYEGTVLDITERKNAEFELAATRERERATAARIQQTLLLGEPPTDVPWLDIGVLTQASQAIDGDFYDFYKHNADCVDIVVGDVMGKGIPAALLGAGIKSRFLRALAQLLVKADRGTLPEPEQIISVMHQELTGHFIGLEFFATMCYLRIDRATRTVTYVDCGHTKTLLCKRDGTILALETDCVPLGFSACEVYSQNRTALEPGDLLVSYSDGVTEATSPDGEMFGLDRLITLTHTLRELPAAQVAQKVRDSVMEYAAGRPLGDDLTVLSIKISD